MKPQLWKKDQLIWIDADQSLGIARILEDSDFSFFRVRFLNNLEERNYTKKNPPFKRVSFYVGQKLKLSSVDRVLIIQKLKFENELYSFECEGRIFFETDVISLSEDIGIVDLIKQNKISPLKSFQLRIKAWALWNQRQKHPLKGAVGCRVQLLPHQFWVLDSALKMPVIRVLLSDEVGLGKTIEAGLICSTLHARKELKKVLILVPAALKVQWLTEFYRRFNIRFRLDHEELIEIDEFRDFVIASLDELPQNQESFDLLIIDEAHRLVHDSARLENLSNIVKRAKHVLFLSATPQIHGEVEFEVMMKVLASHGGSFIKPLIFQSRRSELGISCFRELDASFVKDKKQWIFDFIQEKILSGKKEKVFLIAANVDLVLSLYSELKNKFGEHFALFHELMGLVERDRQAAYFSEPDGAQFLLSSEIGGEGRNFQFCSILVLLDLPADPWVLEQRIGRLDRLGQSKKVKITCPILEDSVEEAIFEQHRDYHKIFERPWNGASWEDFRSEDIGSTDGSESIDPKTLEMKWQQPIFNLDAAKNLIHSARLLGEVDVKSFLEGLYDLCGVEVEDFDLRGNWRISATSLMFVDYFPGLGSEAERILTFEREQALAQEDKVFFSLDHPDVIESLEYLLQSAHGKVVFAELSSSGAEDIQFWVLQSNAHEGLSKIKAWSLQKNKEVTVEEDDLNKIVEIPNKRISNRIYEILAQNVELVIRNLGSETTNVDALLVVFCK